jgi:Protein of unknown function (DUF1173)
MTRYKIGEIETSSDSPDFQGLVERAYKDRVRPLCLCREPGIPMYIAHFEHGFLVKRMPDSGEEHAANCDSFETPAVLSGRGEVDGSAIQENDSGLVSLKFAFSLRRNAPSDQAKEPTEHSSATASGTRLTLRAFLHYLWEESKLTQWGPEKKLPSWFHVRRDLIKVAQAKEANKTPLADVLYVPEYFDPTRKAEIFHRRTVQLSPIMGKANFGKKMMVLIGEVENIQPARYGWALNVKHLRDMPFKVSEELHKNYDKIFKLTLNLWDTVPTGHMMVAATFTMDASGTPDVQELILMLTSNQWLPMENAYDVEFTSKLIECQRSFNKNLRYNLTLDKPIASAILTDVDGDPVPMYLDLGDLVSKWATSESIKTLIETSQLPAWVWDPLFGVPPSLPPKRTASDAPITVSAHVVEPMHIGEPAINA